MVDTTGVFVALDTDMPVDRLTALLIFGSGCVNGLDCLCDRLSIANY